MSEIRITAAHHWYIIRFMARHIFCCWPRRWSYEYQGRGSHDQCSYRRTCLRCGLIHEYEA